MANESFKIGEKAEELYISIFDLTTSRQHYPVRFRRLSDKMQEYALAIHSNVYDANSYDKDSAKYKDVRFEAKTKAITDCNKLLSLIKYSLHKGLISAATSEKWTELCHDVKYMTLSWRKPDV